MIEQFAALPYRLPLARPWQTSRGALTERRGWLVRVTAGGVDGYGDCAPLAEAGTETPESAWAALSWLRTEAVGRSVEGLLTQIAEDSSPAPAASYAVECALLDLASRRADQSLRRWLSPQAVSSVEVNAALGALSDVTVETLRACCRSGFRVIKIKVGRQEPTIELMRLAHLSRCLPPQTAFRLDVNGAWGMEDAARVIEGLNDLPVESLEEPLRDPDAAALSRLQTTAAFPVALDESLRRIDPDFLLEGLPVRRLVLKPAVIGGIRKTLDLATRARELRVQVVVTSLLESAAGLWPTAQLAAAIASPAAQGLATSGWLANDLGSAPVAARGRISLPACAGSGFIRTAPGKPHV
jgi:o-succinylbenzoate synthase